MKFASQANVANANLLLKDQLVNLRELVFL